jgi:DNA-binding transcriptional regulator YhcF (GntR family)
MKQLKENIYQQICNQIRKKLQDQVWTKMNNNIYFQVGEQVSKELYEQVELRVDVKVKQNV